MKKFLLFCWVIGAIARAQGQVLCDLEFASEAMLTDLDSLEAKLKESHVGPFHYCTESAWQNAVLWARHQCQDSLSYRDFTGVLGQLLQTLQDSHTSLQFGTLVGRIRRERPGRIPLQFAKDDNGVFIRRTMYPDEWSSTEVRGKALPAPGSYVVSIGGMPVDSITTIIDRYSLREGNSSNGTQAITAALMANLLPMVVPVGEELSMTTRIGGDTVQTRTPLLDRKAMKAAMRSQGEQFSRQMNLSFISNPTVFAAVLEVPSFSAGSARKFHRDLRRSFRAIEREEIHHLILDLRDNTGGSSGRMESLMRYILPDSVAIPKAVVVKQSPLARAAWKRKPTWWRKLIYRRYARKSTEMRKYLEIAEMPDGTIDTLLYTPKPPFRKFHFDGEVALLINGLSGSASVSFAGIFRHLQRGPILGTPCLGPENGTWGNASKYVLPNTGAVVQISTIRFDPWGDLSPKRKSLLPDYRVVDSASDVLQLLSGEGWDACTDAAMRTFESR